MAVGVTLGFAASGAGEVAREARVRMADWLDPD